MDPNHIPITKYAFKLCMQARDDAMSVILVSPLTSNIEEIERRSVSDTYIHTY